MSWSMPARRSAPADTVALRPAVTAAPRRSGGEGSRPTFPNSRGLPASPDLRPDRRLRAREPRGSPGERSATSPALSCPEPQLGLGIGATGFLGDGNGTGGQRRIGDNAGRGGGVAWTSFGSVTGLHRKNKGDSGRIWTDHLSSSASWRASPWLDARPPPEEQGVRGRNATKEVGQPVLGLVAVRDDRMLITYEPAGGGRSATKSSARPSADGIGRKGARRMRRLDARRWVIRTPGEWSPRGWATWSEATAQDTCYIYQDR